ncbi:hypothetical protein BpHYR1_040649 [Brachionus plicatilis]|uniref:Uncharacterized protein n=1 Tax=Brachionus plicatilis TaxID=10195 RepID=A0A3M7QHD4_BRAPC|nr:hypothetical protein BpHYR1_040649 [Brachionus plicatilis]
MNKLSGYLLFLRNFFLNLLAACATFLDVIFFQFYEINETIPEIENSLVKFLIISNRLVKNHSHKQIKFQLHKIKPYEDKNPDTYL